MNKKTFLSLAFTKAIKFSPLTATLVTQELGIESKFLLGVQKSMNPNPPCLLLMLLYLFKGVLLIYSSFSGKDLRPYIAMNDPLIPVQTSM